MTALIIAVVVVGFVFLIYNSLVKLKVMADGAWADIDVQLKRRHDLVPNLVETVKGYASHERGTLEAVIDARSRAMSAVGPAAKGQAEGELTGALKSLFALSEAYPQLRAAENFGQLQSSLSEIEDVRRQGVYDAVRVGLLGYMAMDGLPAGLDRQAALVHGQGPRTRAAARRRAALPGAGR